MADYIPAPDGDFDAWQANFIAYASANAAALGLDPLVDIPPLTAAQGTWTTDYAANTAAQAAAQSAREGKDAARDAFEGVLRPLVQILQASPDVDNTERAALGLYRPRPYRHAGARTGHPTGGQGGHQPTATTRTLLRR